MKRSRFTEQLEQMGGIFHQEPVEQDTRTSRELNMEDRSTFNRMSPFRYSFRSQL
jgi:hypothetical protein